VDAHAPALLREQCGSGEPGKACPALSVEAFPELCAPRGLALVRPQ
jgi:hypothetical protein